MSDGEAAGRVRDLVEASQRRDWEAVRRLVAAGFILHGQGLLARRVRGGEDFVALLEATARAFPDAVEAVDALSSDGDRVWVRTTVSASQSGPLATLPPSGVAVRWSRIAEYRIAGGRIAEGWWARDDYALLCELGHLDPPPPTADASAAPPEAVVLIGLQAAGKTTFYRDRYLATHVRISRDLLRTPAREGRFLRTCLSTRAPFVVDNTNATRTERARFILPARAAGFRMVGRWFGDDVAACLARNEAREGLARIPRAGVLATAQRFEAPTVEEGFDELRRVHLREGDFEIEGDGDGLR
jgi:predicted ester cyclase/predicted kinase